MAEGALLLVIPGFTKCTVYSALEEKLWGCMVLVTLVFCKVLEAFSHIERARLITALTFSFLSISTTRTSLEVGTRS